MNFSRNLKRLMLVSLALLFLMGANFQQPQTVYPEQSAQNQRKVSAKSAQSQLTFRRLDVPMDSVLQEWTYDLCWRHKIDFTLIMAMIQVESNFNPDVISATDDYGLMQINKMNHKRLAEKFGITDFCDPYANILAGTSIVKDLFNKYQTPEKVLMAYNMGEAGAAKLWQQGIFEINYSKKVLAKQQEFEQYIRGNKK